jgi:hypothetical protein
MNPGFSRKFTASKQNRYSSQDMHFCVPFFMEVLPNLARQAGKHQKASKKQTIVSPY